jgi:hypothetical protein
MNRFNVRPIPPPPEAITTIITDKKPSAYQAMKHGAVGGAGLPPPEEPKELKEPKRGRPSKDDVRRHKLAMASAQVALLVDSKPTRNKIRDYMQSRIEQLDLEKL